MEDEIQRERSITANPQRAAWGVRALWIILIVIVVASFAVLLYYGREIYQESPPVPETVATSDGEVIFTGDQIRTGQDVWRSVGGQELGSVWGHGAYTAPDWTADWLHREAEWLVEYWAAEEYGTRFELLHEEPAAGLEARLRSELRANTFDPSSETITVSPLRAQAIRAVQDHYTALFGDDPELDGLRESYAMPRSVIPDAGRREAFTSFIFWASWACYSGWS